MPRKKNKAVFMRLDDDQAARLKELARMYNLPQAEIVGRLVSGKAVPDPTNHRAVEILAELNSQLRLIRAFLEGVGDDPHLRSKAGRVSDSLEVVLDQVRQTALHLNGKKPPPLYLTRKYMREVLQGIEKAIDS